MNSIYDIESNSKPRQTTWKTKWKCIWCGESIDKGEIHWRYNGYLEGYKQNWGMHNECYGAFQENHDNTDGLIYPHENKRGLCEAR
jgi:hypothetical protein